jgi:hypothetical protein
MPEPAPGTGHSPDYRVLLARTAGISLLAAVSVVVLVATHLLGVAALGTGLLWLVIAAVRRELRIRRRLADTAGTRPLVSEQCAPRPSTADATRRSGGTR